MKHELQIGSQDRILVVAPHPDDESIGCGGLLALYGRQCDILLLTDGRKGHTGRYDGREEELVQIRELELKRAVALAGVSHVHACHVPDGELFGSYGMVKEFDIRPYDYIFVPNRMESHEDHRMAFRALKRMKREQKAKAELVEYEVWTPLTRPTCCLDITSVIETKRNMILQHKSQMMDIDYAEKGVALSCYRGIHMNVPYAEAYAIDGRVGLKKRIAEKIPKAWKRKLRQLGKKS